MAFFVDRVDAGKRFRQQKIPPRGIFCCFGLSRACREELRIRFFKLSARGLFARG